VTVGFLESSYTVSESDESVEVCLGILSPGELDLTVIATLRTRDQTAKGKSSTQSAIENETS